MVAALANCIVWPNRSLNRTAGRQRWRATHSQPVRVGSLGPTIWGFVVMFGAPSWAGSQNETAA